jgi:peroxiredoxin
MVSTDPPERNESFSRDVGDGFPVLSDTTGKAARAFGVVDDARVVPRRWTFYVDAEGIIRERAGLPQEALIRFSAAASDASRSSPGPIAPW